MKRIMLLIILAISLTLVGCSKEERLQADTVVIDGYNVEVVIDGVVKTEYYLIVDLDGERFTVNVPIKNKLAGINSFMNYPKNSIIRVYEDELVPYKEMEDQNGN